MMPRLSELYHRRLTDLPEDLDFSYLSKVGMAVGGCSLGRSRRRHMGSVGGYGRNGGKAMHDVRLGQKSISLQQIAARMFECYRRNLVDAICSAGKLGRFL